MKIQMQMKTKTKNSTRKWARQKQELTNSMIRFGDPMKNRSRKSKKMKRRMRKQVRLLDDEHNCKTNR